MPRYLLTLSDESARAVEKWLDGQLRIGRPGLGGVPVAGLDAVTEEEIALIRPRLSHAGPMYHASAFRPRTDGEVAERMTGWRGEWGGQLCRLCGGRVLPSWVHPGALTHVDREDWIDSPHDVVVAQEVPDGG